MYILIHIIMPHTDYTIHIDIINILDLVISTHAHTHEHIFYVIHEMFTHAQRDKWRCGGNLRMSF